MSKHRNQALRCAITLLCATLTVRGDDPSNAELLAAVRQLTKVVGELNDRVKELEDQICGLKGTCTPAAAAVTAPPSPAPAPNQPQTAPVTVPRRSPFDVLGLSAGPEGPTATATFDGHVRFFQPWYRYGLQAEAQYSYRHDRQEAQIDAGGVVRFSSRLQSGLFASFRHVNLKEWNAGGTLGQGSVTLDYIVPQRPREDVPRTWSARFGGFANFSFLDHRPLGTVAANGATGQLELRAIDQFGATAHITWDRLFGMTNPILEAQYSALHFGGARAGLFDATTLAPASTNFSSAGMVRLIKPVTRIVALSFELDANNGLIQAGRTDWRGLIGLQFGLSPSPAYEPSSHQAAPVEIPRIRYEVLRSVRVQGPSADAGPNQIGIPAGMVTLDGRGSHASDNSTSALVYRWTQSAGPSATIQHADQAVASFQAAPGTVYGFVLRVTDARNGQSASARTTVTTRDQASPTIASFAANPPSIKLGDSSQLSWDVRNADTITITQGVDTGNKTQGTAQVNPQQTTVYTLTAKQGSQSVSRSVTVSLGEVRILRFQATPDHVQEGDPVTLSWNVDNAKTIAISADDPSFTPLSQLPANGGTTVHPSRTTAYTIQASAPSGNTNSTITVAVSQAPSPVIVRFAVDRTSLDLPGPVTLSWQVLNSTAVSIDGGIGSVDASGSITIPVAQTTTWTLTAKNATGTISAPVTVTINPRVLDFSADPPDKSGNSTLRWNAANATTVDIQPGIGTALPAQGSIPIRVTADQVYTLIAHGGSTQVTATLRLSPQPPSPPLSPVVRIVELGAPALPAHLDGSGSSDPQGLSLSFEWHQIDGPAAASIRTPSAPSTYIQIPVPGTYSFELVVTNSAGVAGRGTISVTR